MREFTCDFVHQRFCLPVLYNVRYQDSDVFSPELSTGRMDPRVGSGRVGSGHDFAGIWRGRVSTSDFSVFTDYFLVPKSI